jgi:large subunit ribosomal protein L25
MSQIALNAKARTETGKGPAHRLKAQGRFPAIVYGGSKGPESISLDSHEFEVQVKHGLRASSLITIEIEGRGTESAVLREVQREPVKKRVQHVDFFRVEAGRKIEFDIPVVPVGQCEAVRQGGILERLQRTIPALCDPFNVPEHIGVPIDVLDYGKPIMVKDLNVPDGVDVSADPRSVVFSVVVPRAQVSAAEGEGEGEGAEPAAGDVPEIGEEKGEGDEQSSEG